MRILAKKISQKQVGKKRTYQWFHRLISSSRFSPLVYALLLTAIGSSICSVHRASASETEAPTQDSSSNKHSNVEGLSINIPANHRMTMTDENDPATENKQPTNKVTGSRQSRQYDGPISTSSTGSYASISSDGGAFVGQVPISGSSYGSGTGYGTGSSSAGNYASDLSGAYHGDPLYMARGYPSPPISHMHPPPSPGYPGVGMGVGGGGPLSTMFPPGLLSSSMFPLITKGFDVSEIVCTAIAVAIGAVIVGAPFILIYLFIMNQMGANGGATMPGGGSISLTGPNASTTVSGRKKRHTSLPEALFKQLSPLVNSEQVAQTFKHLMSSIAKYQM